MSSLEAPFTKEEIFMVLKESDVTRALGPNSFPLKFAQTFWQIFKDDMVVFFQAFYSYGDFDHRFSEAFFLLILRIKSPSSLNDLKPISLLE